ncbi:MAG: hypothetical protein K1X86_00120 [Ignavibacteria bacterium]|nr:hypothetical protein [Ignavibacteria bacterium]
MVSAKNNLLVCTIFLLLSLTYINTYSKPEDFKCSNNFTLTTNQQSFKEFAKDFINNGISDLSSFKIYCENKIEAIDFDKGDWVKESISKTYKYLKYYFEFKKYKIKKSKIDFTDGEFTVTLYFRKNDEGEWKLYKYDGVA